MGKRDEYDHIILNEQEVVKQEMNIQSGRGRKSNREKLVLTDKRIYFSGKQKKRLISRKVSRFVNLNAIFAGSRSRGRYPLLLLVSILVLIASAAAYVLQTYMGQVLIEQLFVYVGIGFGGLLLLVYFFLTEKIITLEYPGGNMEIGCNRMKEKHIDKLFRLISSAIDNS